MSKFGNALIEGFSALIGSMAIGALAGKLVKKEHANAARIVGGVVGATTGAALAAAFTGEEEVCGQPGGIPGPPRLTPPAPAPAASSEQLVAAPYEPPGDWTIWGYDDSGKTWFVVWTKYQAVPSTGARLTFDEALHLAVSRWRVAYVFNQQRNTYTDQWYPPGHLTPSPPPV